MGIEQDQTPYKGDEPKTEGLAEIPKPKESPLKLDKEYLDAQQSAEDAKESERDAQREEHNRRTAGGDPR